MIVFGNSGTLALPPHPLPLRLISKLELISGVFRTPQRVVM